MKLIAPFAATLALALSACATTPAAQEMVTVTGEATYRERIALPPDAVMTVRIEDVSRADAPAPVLAEESYPAEGRQVPLPFAVEVPRAALEGAITTSARVRIEDGDGRLMWITDTRTPVTPVAGEARIDLGTLVMVRTRD
ncbi:YbaY family lipoprotein [Alterinioella nitratireducens]|jgi:putative lipoprotein|uniref:YbaY family lipoprotein n=1 Tax=Alterinioella nitratireducens TaxID=2735915 RepID=UPI0017B0DBC9|nr:YbaY family lipoprotein [Erythrobacter sp.]